MRKAITNAWDALMGLALRMTFGMFMFGVAMLLLMLHLQWIFFYKEDEYG